MMPPISATRRLSACGPPVDEPISNTRGDTVGIGRSVIEGGAATSSTGSGTIDGADFVSSGARAGEATERRRFARRPSCRIFSIRSRRKAVEALTSRLLPGFGM